MTVGEQSKNTTEEISWLDRARILGDSRDDDLMSANYFGSESSFLNKVR
jgi:hypothetical protein